MKLNLNDLKLDKSKLLDALNEVKSKVEEEDSDIIDLKPVAALHPVVVVIIIVAALWPEEAH